MRSGRPFPGAATLEATAAAFRGGYFHSGDAAVVHPDGYVDIRDRLKDVRGEAPHALGDLHPVARAFQARGRTRP